MKSVFCTLFGFLVTTTSANANLIVNGSFETGTLSSWSSTNTIIVSSNGSHGGSYNAVFSQVSPPSYDTLSQTVSASPGYWVNSVLMPWCRTFILTSEIEHRTICRLTHPAQKNRTFAWLGV